LDADRQPRCFGQNRSIGTRLSTTLFRFLRSGPQSESRANVDVIMHEHPQVRVNDLAHRSGAMLILLATSLGMLVAQIDTSVVNLAIKQIGSDLDAGVNALQWVVDVYNLLFATLMLTGGRLADRFGRRIFIIGLTLFALGSVICAVAPNIATLIGGRAITGLGAALELPTSLSILTLAYADAQARARAIGIWASCNGLGFTIGPTTGGVIVGVAGWRLIFLLIVPICIAALTLTVVVVPESSDRVGRLDVLNQFLAVIALGTLAFGVTALMPVQFLPSRLPMRLDRTSERHLVSSTRRV
jgi:MFS transporter, DHA2 family, methylenomycin A resistance protein